MESIETLRQTVDTVATRHADMSAAITEERQAAADLLRAVIDAIKPALPAICSRWPIAQRPTIEHVDEIERGDWRGCPVSCSPNSVGPDGPEGVYEGSDLFLLDDGSFARLYYFEAPEAEPCIWISELRPVPIETVAGMLPQRIREIIGYLISALREQAAGNSTKRAEQARARAAKLAAVAELLR